MTHVDVPDFDRWSTAKFALLYPILFVAGWMLIAIDILRDHSTKRRQSPAGVAP